MRHAELGPGGPRIRWIELPGGDPVRVFLHGLGSTSAAYFAYVAVEPPLAGRRSLLVDLLGFGISDRPESGYSLAEHADAVAAVLQTAGVVAADVIGHSLGGSVAVLLATRWPALVAQLVLVDANLDPGEPDPHGDGSRLFASYDEADFVARFDDEVVPRLEPPEWRVTFRLADPVAVHRSATGLMRGRMPDVRGLLTQLTIPRTFLAPGNDGPPEDVEGLRAAGVAVETVPDSGHNIMLDNPAGFVTATVRALSGP